MIKLYSKYIIASLTVLVFLSGMSTNVFSTLITTFSGPPVHLSINEINDRIADYNDSNDPDVPFFTDGNWPMELTDVTDPPGEDEITSLELELFGETYVAIKVGGTSYLYRAGPGTWESPEFGQGISAYAVPDSSIMWLLGTSFVLFGLLGRKRKKA
jgi:hypothetical protein